MAINVSESAHGTIQSGLVSPNSSPFDPLQLVRVQVNVKVRPGDPPADEVVHTLWYIETPGTGSITDSQWNTFAASIASAFAGTAPATNYFNYYQGRQITVKVYSIADAKPRPIRGTATYNPTTWESETLSPRELACCMSFWGYRNIPHYRGRIYIGPWTTSNTAELVSHAIQTNITTLGKTLANIVLGSVSSWVVYSPTASQVQPISTVWVNDQWDNMHSREHVEASRVTISVP